MKAEVSLGLALATGVLVWSIYDHAVPDLVDHRVGDVGDQNAAAAEKTARWVAAGAVAGISLMAKDPTVFVVGGAMVIGLSVLHRHANLVNPMTGRATAPVPVNAAVADDQAQPDSAYMS
jgi:hypothetical protein